MNSQRTPTPADAPEGGASRDQTSAASPDRSRGLGSWLATPAIAIIAVVCCAGPFVLGALAAAGAGTWLVAHGYTLGASALVALAALLVWRIRARISQG